MSVDHNAFDYEACLRDCAAGRETALRTLYREEANRLMGVIFNIVRDRATAEDLVHDLFLRIWQRAQSFDPSRGTGRGWIYAIARHLALDSIRFSRRREPRDQSPDELPDVSNSQWCERVNTSHWGMENDRVHDCIMALEPERRTCLYHAYVNGYSQSEISDLLGAPLGSVKSWIKRSLVALKECLA